MLALIADARSDKEIAVELNLSPSTVRAYDKTIYRKLGVHNRVACAVWFLKQQHENDTGTTKAD